MLSFKWGNLGVNKGVNKGVDIKDLEILRTKTTQALDGRYSAIKKLAQEILDSPNPGMTKIGRASFYCG